jgi:hypothetical protein
MSDLSTSETAVAFKPGDVLRYRPLRPGVDPNWCREGLAIVNDAGRAVDTYWTSGNDHVLTEAELGTATLIANLEDWDLHTQYRHRVESAMSMGEWQDYREENRLRITQQHGYIESLYVRKGTQPDWYTKVTNQRAAVAKAEAKLGAAERDLEWQREQLAKLEEGRDV